MQFGPRYNTKCYDICTANGDCLSCHYLGVYLCASRYLKCSFSYAKKSFNLSFNSIFGKLGGADFASSEHEMCTSIAV